VEPTSGGNRQRLPPEVGRYLRRPQRQTDKVTVQRTDFVTTIQLALENAERDCEIENVRQHMAYLYHEEVLKYFYAAEEVAPTTGRHHLQGFGQLTKKATFRGLQEKMAVPGVRVPHLEWMEGTLAQNTKYCKKALKPGTVEVEVGEPRKGRGIAMKESNQERWDETLALARAGRVEETQARMQVCYLRNLKEIAFSAMAQKEDLKFHDNYWIVGKPGVGKSRLARHMAEVDFEGRFYYKDALNKWFDGYNGEMFILVDDLELDAKYQGHLLKTLADLYPCRVEIKGASAYVRPKVVCVTSNYTIEEIFQEELLVQALKRRFKVVKMLDFDTAKSQYKNAQVGQVLTCGNPIHHPEPPAAGGVVPGVIPPTP